MSSSEISVLVTGVGGGSLGREIIKAFKIASRKYKIVAVDASNTSVGLFETPFRYIVPTANSKNYIEILLKICKKEDIQVLVPGSEPEIEVIAKNIKIFSENGIEVLTNPFKMIELCVDKYNLTKFLTSKGVTCPKTILFNNEDSLKDFDNYPLIIKPRKGAGSRNVFLAHDKEESLLFSNYLKKHGHSVLIQEYVGNFENEFTIGILFEDNGKLLTSIAMKRLLEGGLSTRYISNNLHKKFVISSGISQGIFDDFKEIRKMGEKIAKILGTNGPINIQCRNTESGIVPFEINPRFSGTTGSRSLVNHNEPDILCGYRLFKETPKNFSHKIGFVLRDLNEKFITLDEINKIPKL